MAIFKFDDNDVFINTLESYPEYSFYIVSGAVYIDNHPNLSGSHDMYTIGTGVGNKFGGNTVLGVPEGFISLYEKNINRPSGSIVYPLNEHSGTSNHLGTDAQAIALMGPQHDYQVTSSVVSATDPTGSLIRAYVVKDGPKNSIKAVDDPTYNTAYQFGDLIETRYKLSASISQFFYGEQFGNKLGSEVEGRIPWGIKQYSPGEGQDTYTVPYSIQGILDKYSQKSPHFKMVTTAPIPVRDLATTEMCLIDIPSIFYGKKIKPGSVELNYFVSGSLIGTLKDRGQNGELIQTFLTSSSDTTRPNMSGSVQGIVLYNEGVVILTGSYAMGDTTNSIRYRNHKGGLLSSEVNKWTHFGSGLHQQLPAEYPTAASASFEIKYQGVSQTPTVMMRAQANYGELNWSNNPTYLKKGDLNYDTSTISNYRYIQQDVKIANTTHTQLSGTVPLEQKKETYITKVAIYDDKRNLIGVASLANPVRKTEDRQYTFKLKLDL